MANPNPNVWGTSESWEYSINAYGLETETAETANCAKPKCNNFGYTVLTDYDYTIYSGVLHNKITLNQPLDASICPCGQAPAVSPFANLAIFNENNDLSITPSKTISIRDHNINWFFCDRKGSNNSEYFSKIYNRNDSEGLAYEQFAPKAATVNPQYNPNLRLSPYTKYGIKSLVLTIQVHCVLKTATQAITGTFWATLDDWKNNYSSTYNICGIRLFVRNCTNISGSTLTYNNDSSIPAGNCAGEIAVITDINVMNNGSDTLTEFLTFFQETGLSERCCYIFDRTSTIYNWNDYRDNRAILSCWNYFDGQTLKRTKPIEADPECYYWYSIPYSENNYNKIMAIAALFGCYFTPTAKYSFNENMLDSDLCLTVLDDNGVAHGEYTRGSANANNSLYNKNSIREVDYDPYIPLDPNTYSNTTGFNSLSSSAAMTRRYVLNAANVEKLGDDLWTICNDLATGGDFEYFDGKLKDEFLTTNPIDSIVSLQRFPFSIPHTFAPSKSAVRLGKTDGSAQGYLTNNPFNTIVFNGIDIFARFGNCFLDYEPFTSYELYVPFCGTTKIRAADIIGHKLNLTMQIDLMTGNCTAYIMADQLVIETLNGSCGVDMQLSGIQSATVAANLYNGILGQQQAKTNMIAQGASALLPSSWVNPVGYAAKGEQAETTYKQATYAIEHTETPVHSIGSASALLAWVQEFDARLIIYYPEGDVISSAIPPSFNDSALAAFGHLKGFATVDPGKVSNYQMRGKAAFLQGDILAENIPCTLSERNKIKAFFAEGVYLPPISQQRFRAPFQGL